MYPYYRAKFKNYSPCISLIIRLTSLILIRFHSEIGQTWIWLVLSRADQICSEKLVLFSAILAGTVVSKILTSSDQIWSELVAYCKDLIIRVVAMPVPCGGPHMHGIVEYKNDSILLWNVFQLILPCFTLQIWAPEICYVTLAQHATNFAAIWQVDAVPGCPIPDLQATRYYLTGWNLESTYITGINTSANLIGDVHEDHLPYIQRDYDSLIGFSPECPVSKDMLYFPNPSLSHMQSKPLHIKHKCQVGIQVSNVH